MMNITRLCLDHGRVAELASGRLDEAIERTGRDCVEAFVFSFVMLIGL